jgi:prepilin-type N-terminal cleavage/methylation domain-containing protein
MRRNRVRNERGFTLIEMVMVAGLVAVMLGMAVLISPSLTRKVRADSGVEQIVSMLRAARETAVGQRRNVQIRFVGRDVIQTARVEIPGGATTVLQTTQFESRMEYYLMPGLPDTPDLFGNPAAVAFGPSPIRMFTSEGTLVDASGDLLNGTLFLGIPGEPETARAITVFGATALLRVWRWDGRRWVE